MCRVGEVDRLRAMLQRVAVLAATREGDAGAVIGHLVAVEGLLRVAGVRGFLGTVCALLLLDVGPASANVVRLAPKRRPARERKGAPREAGAPWGGASYEDLLLLIKEEPGITHDGIYERFAARTYNHRGCVRSKLSVLRRGGAAEVVEGRWYPRMMGVKVAC